jgi:Insertion element 4 transposase N-terminal
VLSYLPAAVCASPDAMLPPAGMVAVRAADLRSSPGDRGAALAPGTLVTFCHPVVTAPAAVQGGRVLADGWLPDFVRLGELERHLGEGVIGELVSAATADGRLPVPQRKRLMSFPLVIRLMVAMTLMPDASYCEALRRLAGLLAQVPFAREWHIPTPKVITCWRVPVPPSVMEELFWQAAGPLVADDALSAVMLAGMPVCGADGSLVNVADTEANRKAFGCSGTSRQHGTGSAPFPQIQAVVVTARAGAPPWGRSAAAPGPGSRPCWPG